MSSKFGKLERMSETNMGKKTSNDNKQITELKRKKRVKKKVCEKEQDY